MKQVDMIGQSYNYLRVLNYAGRNKRGDLLYECECLACGKHKIIAGKKLRHGEIKSCGCMHHKYGHGQTDTRLYHIWCTMKARCNRPTAQKYARYGGRGIKLCEEWQAFENFYKWSMENGYAEDLSIDRIDNDGNYEPSNCRWVDNKTQSNNTSTNRRFVFMGKEYTMAQISDMTNVPYRLISRRISRGWSIEDAINVPLLGGHDLQEYKAGLVESTGV